MKQPPRVPIPEVGSYWRHENGKAYRVLLIANQHARAKVQPTSVVYMGPGGKVYCLPINIWHAQALTAAPDAYIEV